uniref:Elongation of very long chain fatty acids protein n=1 Tax=Saccoglossus kowalevskii TaxID=10224 RepID=A0ABM0M8L7_SACKO|nr:PREDICTED: elongation of very long chain fatty acids protein 6-like [Saccoglossus kowalevskii]
MVEYWFITDVERNHSYGMVHGRFQSNWTDSMIYAGIYMVLVYAGRSAMQQRPKYDLRRALAVWSGSLAIFSIIGFFRVFPKLLEEYMQGGWRQTLCDKSFLNSVSGFWVYLFTLSKVIELFDTMFIVLRKQKLMFLHWYHHVTVLVYSWYTLSEGVPSGIYYTVMNYFVHSLMYSYYALRASRMVKIPVQVNMVITFLQLCQMMMGIYINIYSYFHLEITETCPVYYNNIYWGLGMYYTYFLLFSHFFYSNYIAPQGKKELDTSTDISKKLQ